MRLIDCEIGDKVRINNSVYEVTGKTEDNQAVLRLVYNEYRGDWLYADMEEIIDAVD